VEATVRFAAELGYEVTMVRGRDGEPNRVTVDTAGDVYVIDGGHRRVLKLRPRPRNRS
jgi:hypothetical protein